MFSELIVGSAALVGFEHGFVAFGEVCAIDAPVAHALTVSCWCVGFRIRRCCAL
jgi:hypothetical protein